MTQLGLRSLHVAALLPIVCFCWTQATSGATVYLHQGANDPLSEGFTIFQSGGPTTTIGPVFDDGVSMLDAWTIDDGGTLSGVRYDGLLTPHQLNSLNTKGWRLSARRN